MISLFPYEDCIELKLPVNMSELDSVNYNWIQYNPRKVNSRHGCSITSLDGNDTGVPDLDSVFEYNKLNNTNYKEIDFNKPTVHAKPFDEFLSKFDVGRSHYIKLTNGGNFPWHRDNDHNTFRIIYTIKNCDVNHLIWLEDETLIKLENNKWYFINTKKKHCVIGLSESIFAVFNVKIDFRNMSKMKESFVIE
jgi:hypothetical protein